MPDARLGVRAGGGAITTYPTKYATGEDFDRRANPNFTMVFFDATNFAVLPVGVERMDTEVYTELSEEAGAIGIGGVGLDNFAGLLTTLNLPSIANQTRSIFDHFDGDAIGELWGTDTGTGATVTQSTVAGEHAVLLNTGTTDESHATLVRTLTFPVTASLTLIEARLKISAITDVVFEFGLSDALSETGGLAFSSHDSTPVAVATNAAIMAWHAENTTPGETSTYLEIDTVNASTAARTATTQAFAAATYYTFAIAIDSDGDAGFFVNGTSVGSKTTAVATSAVLTPWISVKVKEASAARTVTVDYIRVSTDE